MERLTRIELAARWFARTVLKEFEGQDLTDEELARWVRERLPAIPEHVALEQIQAIRV
jgi:hypothetical protein